MGFDIVGYAWVNIMEDCEWNMILIYRNMPIKGAGRDSKVESDIMK